MRKFYQANEKGEIVIPYRKAPLTVPTVAVHRGVCSLQQVTIQQETYRLDCTCVANK